MRDLLERASLVGGEKFRAELAEAIHRTASYVLGTTMTPDRTGRVAPLPPIMGDMQGTFLDTFNPFDQFRNRDAKTLRLVEGAMGGIYFIVASAYDYDAAARNEKKLLWRTRMTLCSSGVNMVETLPPLVDTAAPYFGREMKEPAVLTKRIYREGRVDIGPVKVEEVLSSPGEPPGPATPARPASGPTAPAPAQGDPGNRAR